MPVTDAEAQKFGEELADVMDLALDKISDKKQVNQYLTESLEVYGHVSALELSDVEKGALAYHVGAAMMQRGKKYFPLNRPPAPTPVP